MTGHAILTPLLMALLLVTGDFITMALTVDRVTPSSSPAAWDTRYVTRLAALYDVCQLTLGTGVIAAAFYGLHFTLDSLRTLAFVTLVFGSQAIVDVARERHGVLHSRPGAWLVASSLIDIALTIGLATSGVMMAPLRPLAISALLVATLFFAGVLETAKAAILALLRRKGHTPLNAYVQTHHGWN